MNFKDMLEKISELSEAVEKTKTGLKHKADPGGYGRKHDTDEEGEEKKEKKPEVKRGRGRPKKGSDETGEVKKYDWSQFGVKSGKDVKLPKWDKSKTTKHSLKEYFEELDAKIVAEGEQLDEKYMGFEKLKAAVAKAGARDPGAVAASVGRKKYGKEQFQKAAAAGKKLGEMMTQQPIPVVSKQGSTQSTGAGFLNIDDSSPAGQAMKDAIGKLAQQKKAQIVVPTTQQTTTQTPQKPVQQVSEKWDEPTKVSPEEKGKYAGKSTEQLRSAYNKLKASGPHKKGSPEFGRMRELAFAIRAKTGWGKVSEADQPPNDSLSSPFTLESKQKVDEGMEHRLKAARHAGKAHALAKEAYNCRYDDMEEARSYHEGFKEGLDECYGIMPVQGIVVGEEMPAATVPGMASQAMEDDLDEMSRTEYMKHKARTTPGDTFKAFGQTFKDKEVLESPFAFESWDNQLKSLLESKDGITEGMSVSISKGNQGAPDSVTVSAQDGEAERLLAMIKQAGLGLFGNEDHTSDYGSPMTIDNGAEKHGEIDVVGDHDGMMSLIKKVTGADHPSDYEEEDHDEACDSCGKSPCGCDESMHEDETLDQREEEVAEDLTTDAQADEEAEAQEDEALAKFDSEEEEVEESAKLDEWANDVGQRGTEEAFVTDADFMINDITSGLNKRKSTGQTTIPVIAGQEDRMKSHMTTDVNESVNDWKKLAGIK